MNDHNKRRHRFSHIQPIIGDIAICELHGKRSYLGRRAAKAAARRVDPTMSPYRCDGCEGIWHVGHLPTAVKKGHVDRRTWYGGAKETC